jgi:hypothetical protein
MGQEQRTELMKQINNMPISDDAKASLRTSILSGDPDKMQEQYDILGLASAEYKLNADASTSQSVGIGVNAQDDAQNPAVSKITRSVGAAAKAEALWGKKLDDKLGTGNLGQRALDKLTGAYINPTAPSRLRGSGDPETIRMLANLAPLQQDKTDGGQEGGAEHQKKGAGTTHFTGRITIDDNGVEREGQAELYTT